MVSVSEHSDPTSLPPGYSSRHSGSWLSATYTHTHTSGFSSPCARRCPMHRVRVHKWPPYAPGVHDLEWSWQVSKQSSTHICQTGPCGLQLGHLMALQGQDKGEAKAGSIQVAGAGLDVCLTKGTFLRYLCSHEPSISATLCTLLSPFFPSFFPTILPSFGGGVC